MDQNNQWIGLFQSIDRLRRTWRNLALEEHSINKSQLFTLINLRYKGISCLSGLDESDPFEPMTLSGLARAMGQTMPALSQRISQLDQMGYVARTQDQNDKRTVWIQLTPEGLELIQKIQKYFAERLSQVTQILGEEKMMQIQGDFHSLASAIEQVFLTE
ncbi:MAG: MarR family winged helix-turn-helix transcriptional regulator [Candidatus Merdivicinus sp.]